MAKTFRPWDVDQAVLFPPSLRDLVPEGHLAHFVRDVVREQLDLSEIYAAYTEERGFPPYHPAMMTALLLYGYCRGIRSSRKLEQSCEERVDFMAVTGMAKPDHSRISEFRRRHRAALSGLFAQVVTLCREAGLVTLGHVSVDGTKIQANASKHAPMSYGRMKKAQSNFTDPESRIMKTGDGFVQAYNAQAAVDAASHVIVAQSVVAKQNDVDQLVPVLDQIEETTGEQAQCATRRRRDVH
jgi:transposase